MRLTVKTLTTVFVSPLLLVMPLLLVITGCARDGNLKAFAYEVIRATNNVQQPGVGETNTNEWDYREYEQKRAEAMRDSEAESHDANQPPEWLIAPDLSR